MLHAIQWELLWRGLAGQDDRMTESFCERCDIDI